MGKSNKKIKSDRINVLRKQYDAFIEEDKKRKERNEYILGRLDKMRYSTALVPVRNTHTPLMNRPPAVYHQLGYQPEISMARDLQPATINKSQIASDIPVKNIDDTYLIQEISKNYILIPKLRAPFVNNYVQPAPPVRNSDNLHEVKDMQSFNITEASSVKPNVKDNTDWKSKYEILNILKKEETEKPNLDLAVTNNNLIQPLSQNDISLNNTFDSSIDPDAIKFTADSDTHARYKYLDEFPEKDMSIEKANYELKMNDDTANNIMVHMADPITQTNINSAEAIVTGDAIDNIDYKLQNTNLEYNYPEADEANPKADPNYAIHEQYINTEPIDPHLSEEQINYEEHFQPVNDAAAINAPVDANVEVTENVYVTNDSDMNLAYTPDIQAQFKSEEPEDVQYVDEQDAKPIQVISSNDLMEEINNSVTLPDSEPVEHIEQEAENSNIQELTPNVEYQMKSTADRTVEKLEINQPHIDVANPEQTQEPQPQIVTNINEIPVKDEQLPDAKGLEAYEAEQRGLFYSENPNVEYDYQQADANVYDQTHAQGDVNVYDQAHHEGNVNVYDQVHPQGEVYPEGQDYAYYENTQQPYPADMGENEEQTLQYDPSYPQQYVDPYESAYEKQPQQQPQQYEESQVYEQTEGYDQQDQLNYETEVTLDQAQVESQLDTEDGYVEQKPDVNAQQVEKPGPDKNK